LFLQGGSNKDGGVYSITKEREVKGEREREREKRKC
jgi:hypothetical protein